VTSRLLGTGYLDDEPHGLCSAADELTALERAELRVSRVEPPPGPRTTTAALSSRPPNSSGYRCGGAETVSDPAVDSVLADPDAGPTSEVAVLWRIGLAGNDPGTGPAGLQGGSAGSRAPSSSAPRCSAMTRGWA
jgi:hypothetical protein